VIRFQRIAQALSLGLFVFLLILAAYPLPEALPVDLFLRLDPAIVVGTVIAARDAAPNFLPGLLVLLMCLFAGRFFCGHVCPMGTTLDLCEHSVKTRSRGFLRTMFQGMPDSFRVVKFIFLGIVLGSAAAGVSLIFLGSPLSLVTRFYGLVLYPLALLIGDQALSFSQFLSRLFPEAAYWSLPAKVFSTNVFVALMFLSIASLGFLQPRFWCRNLCPAGAMLAWFSRKPFVRRTVNENCNQCGKCIRNCPTGAIDQDPAKTTHSECIVCLKCKEICPQKAISFFPKSLGADECQSFSPSRRGMVLSLFAGFASAGLLKTSIHRPRAPEKERPLVDGELIRPPGALPETDFLTRCVRCGECMKACPTNTLQPVWLKAGLEGIFSPVMFPRLAACAVNCNVCGKVCPTGAIRDLSLVEKNHAKVGTAWIAREYCLVWEQDKKCLVCDEVCPYNAVSFRPVQDRRNAVPFVVSNRCTGCGWCESKCPVEGVSAIRVNIVGEVRLADGSYVEKAQEYGFVFRTKDNSADALAPGTFDDLDPVPNDCSGSRK
jgi:MauM/NapG family ferredoxin protein